jgi:hypothetical protein
MITKARGDSSMKRPITIALAFAVAIALPVATAIAANGNGKGQVKSFTAKQCVEQMRAERGAFQATFGDLSGEHAMRNCKRETRSEVIVEFRNAAQFCHNELSVTLGLEDFLEKYGTNQKEGQLPDQSHAPGHSQGALRNAFGKCVSSMVRGEIAEDVDDFQTAAQQCRADRAADPDAFLGMWGNNVSEGQNNAPDGEKSKGAERKAFGKCVSAQGVVEEPTPEEETAPAV